MKIIIIGGYSGSGKDTVGDYLVKNHGYTKISFADDLKKFVSDKYNLPIKYFLSQTGKKRFLSSGKTVRDLLIEEGQIQRDKDENVWVKKVLQKILTEKFDKVVITDFRFPNEKLYLEEKLTEYSFTSIRILRDTIEKVDSPTEHMLDTFQFDFTLTNNESKDDLYFKIENILYLI